MAPFIPESRILHPRPITATNSDSWPEFELHHTSVTSQATGEVVSLLTAREQNPLTVTGTLQPLTSNLIKHYRPGAGGTRTVNIELKNVTFFAYGQTSSGSSAIWAAGEAGWFAIQPARAYRAIDAHMRADVAIFYFIMDVYQEAGWKAGKPRGRNVNAEEVFARLATSEMGSGDVKAAHDEVSRHKEFLLARMLTDEEKFGWEGNPFFVFLQRKFPEEFAVIREQIHSASKDLKAKQTSSKEEAPPAAKKKRGRPPGKRSADSGADRKVLPTRKTRSQTSDITSPTTSSIAIVQPITPIHERSPSSSSNPSDVSGFLGAQQTRLGRSALRPKASKASKSRKGPAGSQTGEPTNAASTSDDEDSAADLATPTAKKGKGKRKSKSSPAPARRSRRLREADSDAEPSSSDNEDAESSSEHSSPSSPASSAQLESSRDPVQEDTFLCPLPPCTHKIYSVSSALGRSLVKEHLAAHAAEQDDDQRIQLVRKLQAPSLPAGRLLEKVLGAATGRTEDGKQDDADGSHGEGLVEGSRVAGTRFPAAPVGQGVVVRY